ncbi:MAG TPA: hypothetical protein VI072_09705 [Polyangiaceae bacterium]
MRALSSRVRLILPLVLLGALAPVSPASAAPPTLTVTGALVGANGVKISWTISGGDSSNLLYVYSDNAGFVDPGFKAQVCSPTPNGCSMTINVSKGGVYRFTVSVKNNAGEFSNRSAEVVVSGLAPPVVPASQLPTFVDMFNTGPRSFSWSRSGAGYVEIKKPGAWSFLPTAFPASGSYTVPASDLAKPGASSWSIQYCEGTGTSKICSDQAAAHFIVGPARFNGDERRFVGQGQTLGLSWSGSGNAWFVSTDPPLGSGVWLAAPSWTFPATAAPGVYDVTLVSCNFSGSGGVCSNRVDIAAAASGVVNFTVATNTPVAEGTQVGSITPAGGSPIAITAPRTGTFVHLVAPGSTVTQAGAIAAVMVDDVDRVQVVVGSASTAAWTTRTWSTDFTSQTWSMSSRSTTGDALDLAFDTAGGLWAIGEFGMGAAYQSGALFTHVNAPLARVGSPNPYPATKPHISSLNHAPSTHSTLAEKVVTGRNAVWYTHGGGLFEPGPKNHSRIIRVALDIADSPATPYDDRVCAIHVPGDNNEVVGAAWDPARNRLWFSAMNMAGPAGGQSTPALYWFSDDGTAATLSSPNFPGCDNMLDYGNAAAVAAAATANLCSSTVTSGCITRIGLPAAAGLLAHIEVDTNGTSSLADDAIWWVDFTGVVLGRHAIGGGFTCHGMPTATNKRSFFGGFPWQLRVSGGFVYIGEYGDNDLVRFAKGSPGGSAGCATVPAPSSGMSEIHVPVLSENNNVHSIEIAGDRLWFTLANEAHVPVRRDASTFGYVSLSSWAAGAPTGVLYTGLNTLGQQSGSRHHSFRGIDVAPNGAIGLADMHYDELVRLTPR